MRRFRSEGGKLGDIFGSHKFFDAKRDGIHFVLEFCFYVDTRHGRWLPVNGPYVIPISKAA